MSIKLISLTVFGGLILSNLASAEPCMPEPDVNERVIPVEMLTGSDWSGQASINMPEVDRSYPVDDYSRGKIYNYDIKLKGPVKWRHPDINMDIQVYERFVSINNASEKFAVRSDKKAAGRVWDSRFPGTFFVEAKFPLGKWKQGESRSFTHSLYIQGKEIEGQTKMEIENISCTYNDISGAVQYRWKSYRRGTLRGDYNYIYGPGKGMMAVIVHKSGKK